MSTILKPADSAQSHERMAPAAPSVQQRLQARRKNLPLGSSPTVAADVADDRDPIDAGATEAPLPSSSPKQLVAKLSREVRKLEKAGRSSSKSEFISSGCAALDACLDPQGVSPGYAPGIVVEYLRTSPACGASYLAFAAAASALQTSGGFIVIVDRYHRIYPPALTIHGINLSQVVFVRPQSQADAVWATYQALRTPAVAAVVAELNQLDDRAARRLQLAAEESAGLALLLRHAAARRAPSWAEIQWLVRPHRSTQHTPAPSPISLQPSPSPIQSPHRVAAPQADLWGRRQLQVQLVRNRSGQAGAIAHLQINHRSGKLETVFPSTNSTGATPSTREEAARERNRHAEKAHVRLATELASPARPSRTAAAG